MGELMRVPSKHLEKIPEGTKELDILDAEFVDEPSKHLVKIPGKEIMLADRSPVPYVDIQPNSGAELNALPPAESSETIANILPPSQRTTPSVISAPKPRPQLPGGQDAGDKRLEKIPEGTKELDILDAELIDEPGKELVSVDRGDFPEPYVDIQPELTSLNPAAVDATAALPPSQRTKPLAISASTPQSELPAIPGIFESDEELATNGKGSRYVESERLDEIPEDAEILEGTIEGESEPTPLPPVNEETIAALPPSPQATPPSISASTPRPELPAAPEATPPNEEFTIVALDRSRDARDFARDIADKRLTEKLNADKEKGGIKGFALRMYNNMRRDVLRQREIIKAEKEIADSNDVLIGLVDDDADRLHAKQRLQQRFENTEFGDEVLSKAAGEKRDIHEQDSPFATSIKEAINTYVSSSDPKAREIFAAEVGRLRDTELKSLRERDGESDKNPLGISLDNILETGDGIKTAIENGASQENIFNNLRIITGEARTGAKTEARYDFGDRVAEKFRKAGVAVGLAPEAAVLAAAYVTSACKLFGSSGLGAAVGTAMPGVVGGIVAGGREWRNLTLERRQNARELAMGGEIDPTDARRREIQEKGGYNVESTNHIISSLQAHLDKLSPAPGEAAPGEDALKAAFEALALAEYRNNIKGKDLLNSGGHVTRDGTVEDFAIVRGRLKVALRHGLDPAIRASLKLDPNMDIDELIADKSKEVQQIAILEKDISDKDKAYRKYQAVKSIKTGAIGAVTGLGLGLAGQEALAMLPFDLPLMNVGTEKTGLVEQLWKDTPDGVHQTVLADWFGPDYGGTQTIGAEAVVRMDVNGKPSIEMNGTDIRVETNVDGTLKVVGADNATVAGNIKLDSKGSLSPESVAQLKEHGINFDTIKPSSGSLQDVEPYQKEVNLEEYMKNHQKDTMHVDRNHMDNGSPRTPNGSELGLHAGPVSPDGTYHFNIANMEDSAYDSNGKRVDVSDAIKNGTVKYLVSPDQGHQIEPFYVNALPDGSLDVSPGSPAAPFLGTGPNGESIVTGAYLEAVNVTGEIDPATGAQKVDVLATVVGNDTAGGRPIMDTIVGEKKEVFDARYSVSVTTTGPEMITDTPVYAAAMPLNSIKPIREQQAPQGPETPRPGGPLSPGPGPGGPEGTPPTPPLAPTPETGINRVPPVLPLDRRPVSAQLDVAPKPPVTPAYVPTPAIGGRERVIRSGGELESGVYRMSTRRRRAIGGAPKQPVTPGVPAVQSQTRPGGAPKPGTGIDKLPPIQSLDRQSLRGLETAIAAAIASTPSPTFSGRGRELESGAGQRSMRRAIGSSRVRPVTSIGFTPPPAIQLEQGSGLYRNRGVTGRESLYGNTALEYSKPSGALDLASKRSSLELTSGSSQRMLEAAPSAAMPELTGSPREWPSITGSERKAVLQEARLFERAIQRQLANGTWDRDKALEFLRGYYGNNFALEMDPETNLAIVRPSLTGEKYRNRQKQIEQRQG